MMDDATVERVAQAIYEDFRKERGEARLVAWEKLGPGDYDEQIRAMYLSRARAALSAMPERELLREALEALEPLASDSVWLFRDRITDDDLRNARAAADKIRAAMGGEKP